MDMLSKLGPKIKGPGPKFRDVGYWIHFSLYHHQCVVLWLIQSLCKGVEVTRGVRTCTPIMIIGRSSSTGVSHVNFIT